MLIVEYLWGVYVVRWQDVQLNRKYHMWLDSDGNRNSDIVCNWIDRQRSRHSKLTTSYTATSDAWDAMVTRILAEIKAGDMLAKAQDEYERSGRAKVEPQFNQRIAEYRDMIGRLKIPIADELLKLNDIELLTICRAIRSC